MTHTSASLRRYELLEVIGKGGFGTVYRAQLSGAGGFSKTVAVKLLHGDAEGATDLVARLRDEARMLGLLHHRAIVRVDGLVKLDGRWAVVMEFVGGASGAELRDAVHVPAQVALALVEEVAAALHEAWTREVDGRPLRLLHRDVKPGNLKLAADGTVKLLDFGIARANFGGREASTRATLFGSLPFMAPERLSLRDNDRSDIFALAITLVELLAGRQQTQPSAERAQHEARVESLVAAVARTIDHPPLQAFVRDCLAFDPAARPDAAGFARRARQLRASFDDLYLPDWAAETVPSLAKMRQRIDDPMVGAILVEQIDDTPHGARRGGGNTFILSEDELDLPTARMSAARPAPPRRRRGVLAWVLGWTLGLGATGAVLATLTALAAAVVVAGGLALAVVGTGAAVASVWPVLRNGAVEREFLEMATALAQVRDGQPRTRLRNLLRRGADRAHDGEVSMWEIVDFRIRFNDSIADRKLTGDEVQILERKYDRMFQ